MNHIQQLITNYIHIWATSKNKKKSNRGRSNGHKNQVYGIQKLRDLILDLGINGNLIKVNKSNFHTITLGEIGQWGSGGTPLKSNSEFYNGNIPWLVIGDLNDGLITKSESHISDLGLKNSSAKLIPKGSLLIAMYGSIGKLGITGIECTTNQAIAFCIPDNKIILTKYLFFYLRSIRNKLLDRGQGLAQQNISQTILKQFKVQIPSLVKQEQIIAKIDELMPLCEQLEDQHINSEEAHDKLVKVLLDSLIQFKDAEEFKDGWQRITDHFDTLFTTEDSVDQLKQTLLKLAVIGKLVPQDHNDGSANELLKKIQVEKAELMQKGKVKNEKPLQKISKSEILFNLPSGWEAVRFGEALISKDAERKPISSDERRSLKGNYDYYGASGVIDKINNYIFDKPLLLIGEDGANLITRSTPIAFIARGKYWVNNHAHVLDGISEQFLKYIELYINSIDLRPYVTGSAQPKMNQAKMNSIILYLPPEKEQDRIIIKLEELMSLCDELKSRIQQASAKQKQIADVLVSQAIH